MQVPDIQYSNLAQTSQTSIILEKQQKICEFMIGIFAKHDK